MIYKTIVLFSAIGYVHKLLYRLLQLSFASVFHFTKNYQIHVTSYKCTLYKGIYTNQETKRLQIQKQPKGQVMNTQEFLSFFQSCLIDTIHFSALTFTFGLSLNCGPVTEFFIRLQKLTVMRFKFKFTYLTCSPSLVKGHTLSTKINFLLQD